MVPKNMTLAPALIVPSFNPHIYRMSNATAKQMEKLISVIRQKLMILFTVLNVLSIICIIRVSSLSKSLFLLPDYR